MKKAGFDVSALMGDGKLQVTVPFNDEVNVVVNYIPRELMAQLLQQATKKVWDSKHQLQEYFDAMLFGELLGVEAVGGWDGLVVKGEPFGCTPENIKILMRKWADFAKFISAICTDLERMVSAEKDAAAKNSGTTSELG